MPQSTKPCAVCAKPLEGYQQFGFPETLCLEDYCKLDDLIREQKHLVESGDIDRVNLPVLSREQLIEKMKETVL